MQVQLMQQMKETEARNRIAMMRDDREGEKRKIKDAILLHKKEEAKQAKFIGQQHKNRFNQFMYQQNQENELKSKLQRQQERI
jgi:hypothetical protein